MWLEIKYLIKNKTTFLCLIFLLCISMFQLFNFKNDNDVLTKESFRSQWEEKSLNLRSLSLYLASPINNVEFTEKMKISVSEYQWKSNLYDQALIQMREDRSLTDYKSIALAVKIKEELINLNHYANGSDSYPYFQDVYKDKLEQYQDIFHTDTFDFDTKKLSLIGGEGSTDFQYQSQMKRINYYFSLLDNNMVEITTNDLNPWSYLVYLLDESSNFEVMISMLGLIYTLSCVMMLRKNNRLYLLCIQPTSLYRVILKQIVMISTIYLAMITISFGAPFLILGIQYGFNYSTLPVYVYESGLTGFSSFLHSELSGFVGLSIIPSKELLSNGSSFITIPNELELITIARYMILAIFLLYIKVITYINIAFTCTIWVRKIRYISFVGMLIIGGVLTSQLIYSQTSVMNLFSLKNPLIILGGGASITYLQACLIFIFYLCITNFINKILSKKLSIE